ncbi:hypothetical protein [Haloarchaeobius sp. DYHT-AS-18]|uniref:hypothetical protein n=1 Tax=Haloarchaeobius sp. DYHT-AS-18 TaxID=3446117 RepID=UPI003EC14278
MKYALIALVVILSGTCCGLTASTAQADTSPGINQPAFGPAVEKQEKSTTITSSQNVKYHFNYNLTNHNLEVVATNLESTPAESWLDIYVDRTFVRNGPLNISANGTRVLSYNLGGEISGDTDQHSIKLSTFGNSSSISFSLNISSQNPNGVELPEIKNVEIDTATIEGEETTVARVTVTNEGQVQYLTKVTVTSLQTHSSGREARVPMDGSRRTVVIPLNEDPEMKVAGEVRLYTGWIHNHSDIEDQVEFVGTVDGETDVWDREYEPVMTYYANVDESEVYQYENETVKQQNDAIWRERLTPIAGVATAMLAGFVVLVSVLSRVRS